VTPNFKALNINEEAEKDFEKIYPDSEPTDEVI
jgi:hypothetical protein